MSIKVYNGTPDHIKYAEQICSMIEDASKKRGTGIAKRDPIYISSKLNEGKAIIAFDKDKLIGFSYIESWNHGKFVATSGLIVHEEYRSRGLGMAIKRAIVELAKKKFPDAKIFGITTSLAVMKINTRIGYSPVTFSELTDDDEFWNGCQNCRNYDILERNNRRMCLCTGMILDPKNKHGLLHKLRSWFR